MNFADDAGNLPPKHSIKSTDIKPSASPNRRQDGSYIDLVDFAGKEETLPSDPSASRQLNNALDEKSAAGGGGDLTDTMTIRRSMEGGRNAQSSGSIHAGASTPRRQQSSTTPVEMNRARTTSREHLAGGHGGSLPTNTSTHAGLPRQRPNSPNKNILLQPITTTRPPTIPTSLQSAPLQSYSEQNLEPPAPLLRRPSTYLVRAPSENRYLSSTKHVAGMLEIVGRTRVSMDDAGRHKWKAVLSGNRLPAPSSSQEAFDLEMLVLQIGESCIKNNATTTNFNTLLLYLLSQMRAMRVVAYDGDWTDEACNALFLVSICVKYAVENTSSMGIHELFEMDRTMSVKHSLSSSGSKPDDPRLELDPHVVNDKRLRSFHLLEELLHVLIYADARTPANYEFYLQTLNLLIILFSTQLNGSGAVEGEYFLEVLLGRLSHFAGGAMQRLLMNAIHRPPPLSASSGVLYSAYSYLFSSQPTKNTPAVSPVGDKSAVLYLILAAQTSSHFGNPFAEVAGRLRDSHVAEMPAPQITDSSDDDDNTVNVSFRNLYQTLCTGMSTPSLPKILYLLLLQNRSFRSYILSRTDPESLLIPILKQIYELHDRRDAFPTLYVLLLVLLILSQDEIWVESIQKITVSQQPWFTDRVVKQNSLGGFAVLLLIRCVQVNLAASKDAYCHVLHIAILTNLGCGLIGMSAVVAQRLVGFYDMIAKRYHRILAGFNSTQATPMQTPITTTAPALLVFPDSFDDHQGGGPDTHIYSDILAALLEIINAVFTHSLRLNPELIYAVLHSPERFTPLSHHPRFHPLVANIELVMGYFSGRVEERRGAWGGLASAQDVAGEIERGVRTWKGGGCEVYSGMKYILEVGEGTDGIGEHNFAVGYAWECAVKQACIHWQSTPLLDAFEQDCPEFTSFGGGGGDPEYL